MDIRQIEKKIDDVLGDARSRPAAVDRSQFSATLEVPKQYRFDRKGRSPKDILVKIKNRIKSMRIIGGIFRWVVTIVRIHVRIEQLYSLIAEIKLFRLAGQLINVENEIRTLKQNIEELKVRSDNTNFDVRHNRNLAQTELSELKNLLSKQKLQVVAASGSSEQTRGNNDVMSDQYADLYVAFEDHFRNNAANLQDSYEPYRKYIEQLPAEVKSLPCIDVGCGKGYWLSYLKDQGFKDLRGVDSNYAMVNAVKSAGFSAVHADGIKHLSEQPSNSFAIVSAFHVVEHLPVEVLVTLIDEAARIVAPNGFVLFETPNPENLVVGACNFYADLTHRNPIPPQTLDFLLLRRGFKRTAVVRKAFPKLPVKSDDPAVAYLLDWFAKGQDYAVIGYKE